MSKFDSEINKIKLCIVDNFGAGVFTRPQLLKCMERDFPKVQEGSILVADYCVNRKSTGQQIADDERFLYWVGRGKYRLYNPQQDGKWGRKGYPRSQVD